MTDAAAFEPPLSTVSGDVMTQRPDNYYQLLANILLVPAPIDELKVSDRRAKEVDGTSSQMTGSYVEDECWMSSCRRRHKVDAELTGNWQRHTCSNQFSQF